MRREVADRGAKVVVAARIERGSLAREMRSEPAAAQERTPCADVADRAQVEGVAHTAASAFPTTTRTATARRPWMSVRNPAGQPPPDARV